MSASFVRAEMRPVCESRAAQRGCKDSSEVDAGAVWTRMQSVHKAGDALGSKEDQRLCLLAGTHRNAVTPCVTRTSQRETEFEKAQGTLAWTALHFKACPTP